MSPRKVTPDDRAKELGQILTAIEVAICIVAVVGLTKRTRRAMMVVAHLRALADHAVYQTEGPDPATLDRIADQIELGHANTVG